MDKSVKNFRLVGIVLFFAGATTAITAAAKMAEAGDKYPNTVPAFVVALGLAIIGNLIWHKSEKKFVSIELEKNKNDLSFNPTLLLQKIPQEVSKLKEIVAKESEVKACDAIDKVFESFIFPFIDKRKTFMDIHGKAKGAEILLIAAYAERMLNRTWSAISDGHRDEAKSCLEEAIENFEMANEKLG